MSADYDFLHKMFNRLHEARQLRAKVGFAIETRDTRLMADNYIAAIEYSIRDYLEAHGRTDND